MRTHRTAAWPLAGFYAALVVYASLFRFQAGAIRVRPGGHL